MGGMIPFGDASRRPRRSPVITTAIIAVNALVFILELTGGDPLYKVVCIPADIVAITLDAILTAMFGTAAGCTFSAIWSPVGIWPGRRCDGAAPYLGFYLLMVWRLPIAQFLSASLHRPQSRARARLQV